MKKSELIEKVIKEAQVKANWHNRPMAVVGYRSSYMYDYKIPEEVSVMAFQNWKPMGMYRLIKVVYPFDY